MDIKNSMKEKTKNEIILNELKRGPKSLKELKNRANDIRSNIGNLLNNKKIKIAGIHIEQTYRRFTCNDIIFEAIPEDRFIISNIREIILQLNNLEYREKACNDLSELIENKIKELEIEEKKQWKSLINSIEFKPLNNKIKLSLILKEDFPGINRDFKDIVNNDKFLCDETYDPMTYMESTDFKEVEKKYKDMYYVSIDGIFQDLISQEQSKKTMAKEEYLKKMGTKPPEIMSFHEKKELITKIIYFIEIYVRNVNHFLDINTQKEAELKIAQLSCGLSSLKMSISAFKGFIDEMEKWYQIIQQIHS